jgi:hypothetical protein
MKILIDFLSLRPVWTRRGLEIAWYAYFLATLIQLAFYLSLSYSAFGNYSGSVIASAASYFSFAFQIVFLLAHLALVRIFLEIALNFLVKPAASSPL